MKKRHKLEELATVPAGRRIFSLGVITVISLAITISLPFLLTVSGFRSPSSVWKAIALIAIVLVVIPLVVSTSVLISIALPFDEAVAWRKRVLLVVICFLAVVLIYAGVYFSIAGFGDYNQAVRANLDFQYAEKRFSRGEGTREELVATIKDVRPFKGMGYSLYLAIDADPDEYSGDRRYLNALQIVQLAQDENERHPRLNSKAGWWLFADCLHFSVATAATVGYGDISPSSSFSRLVADTQILASVSILVVGLGFVMSGRPQSAS